MLGSLMEKAVTTPDGYPLSLNSLVTACNQTTNRDPIVAYSDELVDRTLEQLREKGLSRRVMATGQRVVKHRQVVEEGLGINAGEFAVLGVLLLRGAQTPGELKSRTERWHRFRSLDDVEEVLTRLAARDLDASADAPARAEGIALASAARPMNRPTPTRRRRPSPRRPATASTPRAGTRTRGRTGAGPAAARAAFARGPEPGDRCGRAHRRGHGGLARSRRSSTAPGRAQVAVGGTRLRRACGEAARVPRPARSRGRRVRAASPRRRWANPSSSRATRSRAALERVDWNIDTRRPGHRAAHRDEWRRRGADHVGADRRRRARRARGTIRTSSG